MAHVQRQFSHAQADVWARAVENVREVEAQFEPIRMAYNEAERAWFAVRNDRTADADAVQQVAKARLDEATEQERLYGNALFDAASAVYRLPAPHLAGLIAKVEMVRTIGYDGSVEQLVLQDLRRLAQFA